MVYLGSHVFKGLAREAALKLLELTDGGMIAASDSPLGFRHGPKTIVNDRTLVVIFLSNDAYTRRYDLDLLEEIRRDGRAGGVLAICGRDDGMPAGVERILIPAMAGRAGCRSAVPVHRRAADVRVRGSRSPAASRRTDPTSRAPCIASCRAFAFTLQVTS